MFNLEDMIERIRELKKANNLSNEALSNLSGVPKGTLAKILGSETKDPQVSNIIKLSQALGASADYVIFGKTETKNDDNYIDMFSSLNAEGQKKVVEYMLDLGVKYSKNEKTAAKGDSVSDDINKSVQEINKAFQKKV